MSIISKYNLTRKIKVMIVDDHELVRDGIELLLKNVALLQKYYPC